MQPQFTIPVGFCQCGCGQKTTIIPKTNKRYGWVKGEAMRFIHGHNAVKPDITMRICALTSNSNGCTEWNGVRTPNGYGTISYRGQVWYTHRLVWALANGPIPEGLEVLHQCDNPPCMRLDHLFLGTHLDNMRDMALKRRRRGRPTNKGQTWKLVNGHRVYSPPDPS